MSDPDYPALAGRYLLGKLSPEDEERFEAGFFGRRERLAEVQSAEDDLIDAYVAGRLAPEDRERFEARLMASEAQTNRIAFARALHKAAGAVRTDRPVAPHARRRRTLPYWSAAAAVALAAVGGWWTSREWRGLRDQVDAARARERVLEARVQDQARRIDEQALDPSAARSPAAGAVRWMLHPALDRNGPEAPALRVRGGTAWVCLEMPLDAEDGRYVVFQARLETPEGRAVASQDGLPVITSDSGRATEMMVPAGLLAPGTYIVVLSGTTTSGARSEVETYPLRVSSPR